SGGEVINAIKLQENALAMQQEEFDNAYEKSVAYIEALLERSNEEIKLIDKAAQNVKDRISPLIEGLENELKQAAQEAIESIIIKPTELRNKKALSDKLGHQVSENVQKSAQKESEKIQGEIEEGLVNELNRLEELSNSVIEFIKGVEMEFVFAEASTTAKTNETGEMVVAAITTYTGLGGVWAGYREAGIKGAAVGGVGSVGTAFTAYTAAILLGLPLGFPVFVAVTVLSMFAGRELVKVVFGEDQVDRYKESYQNAALQEISKQLKENHIERNVNEQISEIFYKLKQRVRQEVDARLDNTQNQLFELREKRSRQETLTEQERQGLKQMKTETQRILDNAQRLSQQLVQQVNLIDE
ncbi:MAG: dynamin family protein, partial [Okeania sp. SIO3C4]|nr:dynamin family protein [Okeania sp. SIO3C4]